MEMGEVAGRRRDKNHQVWGRKTKNNWSNKQLICKTVSKLSSASMTALAIVFHVVLCPHQGSLETANSFLKIDMCCRTRLSSLTQSCLDSVPAVKCLQTFQNHVQLSSAFRRS